MRTARRSRPNNILGFRSITISNTNHATHLVCGKQLSEYSHSCTWAAAGFTKCGCSTFNSRGKPRRKTTVCVIDIKRTGQNQQLLATVERKLPKQVNHHTRQNTSLTPRHTRHKRHKVMHGRMAAPDAVMQTDLVYYLHRNVPNRSYKAV